MGHRHISIATQKNRLSVSAKEDDPGVAVFEIRQSEASVVSPVDQCLAAPVPLLEHIGNMLHILVAAGNVHGVKSVLASGSNIDLTNAIEETAVSIVSKYGFCGILEVVLLQSSKPKLLRSGRNLPIGICMPEWVP